MFHPIDLFVCTFCFVLFNKRRKRKTTTTKDSAKILTVNNSTSPVLFRAVDMVPIFEDMVQAVPPSLQGIP